MEHTNPGLSFVCLESRYDPLRGALSFVSNLDMTPCGASSLSFVSNLDMTPCGARSNLDMTPCGAPLRGERR